MSHLHCCINFNVLINSKLDFSYIETMILASNKIILPIYNILKNVTNYTICVNAHFITYKEYDVSG